MTVQELIEILSRHPGDATVVFTPDYCCSGGYPEWERASAVAEEAYDSGDNLFETGVVLIELKGEREA